MKADVGCYGLPRLKGYGSAKADLLVNEYVGLTIKSDARTRAHSQSFAKQISV